MLLHINVTSRTESESEQDSNVHGQQLWCGHPSCYDLRAEVGGWGSQIFSMKLVNWCCYSHCQAAGGDVTVLLCTGWDIVEDAKAAAQILVFIHHAKIFPPPIHLQRRHHYAAKFMCLTMILSVILFKALNSPPSLFFIHAGQLLQKYTHYYVFLHFVPWMVLPTKHIVSAEHVSWGCWGLSPANWHLIRVPSRLSFMKSLLPCHCSWSGSYIFIHPAISTQDIHWFQLTVLLRAWGLIPSPKDLCEGQIEISMPSNCTALTLSWPIVMNLGGQ